uniref:Uncharacterized protein n=1 Tax=Setaria digitata TaxID=48799 RepID=A0A915PX13_9BILA
MRDDYEYALEGIAVDYVTNRPKTATVSRTHKNKQRINNRLQNNNNNNNEPYPFSSLSSASRGTIVYQRIRG